MILISYISGIDPSKSAPNFYHTKPITSTRVAAPNPFTPGPSSSGKNTRTSRRLRGMDIEETSPLELVEKQWAVEKSLKKNSPMKSPDRDFTSADEGEAIVKRLTSSSKKKTPSCRRANSGDDCSGSAKKSSSKRDIWGSSGYRCRKKKRVFRSESRHREGRLPDSGAKETRFSDTDDYDVDEAIARHKVSPSSKPSGKSPEPSGRRNSVSSTGRRNSVSNRSRENSVNRDIPRSRQSTSRSPTRYSSGKSDKSRSSKSPERLPSAKTQVSHGPSSPKYNELSVVVENIAPNKPAQGKSSPRVGTSKPMETDSGISSSVDSNGDSVDSVEHAKQLAEQVKITHILHKEGKRLFFFLNFTNSFSWSAFVTFG